MPAIHQLDISYRNGPLAVDDRAEPGQLCAGDRAPDGVLADGGCLFDGYNVTNGTFVLVRPDGYIGANQHVPDTIRVYLNRMTPWSPHP
jgi:hypothetical protein